MLQPLSKPSTEACTVPIQVELSADATADILNNYSEEQMERIIVYSIDSAPETCNRESLWKRLKARFEARLQAKYARAPINKRNTNTTY